MLVSRAISEEDRAVHVSLRSCTTHKPSRANTHWTVVVQNLECYEVTQSEYLLIFYMLFPGATFSSLHQAKALSFMRRGTFQTQIACSRLDKLEMRCRSPTTTTAHTAVTCVFSRRPTDRINSHRWSFSMSSRESASFSSNTSGSGLLSPRRFALAAALSHPATNFIGVVVFKGFDFCLCVYVMLTLLCFLLPK